MSWPVWHVRGHLCVPFGVSSFSLELSAAFWAGRISLARKSVCQSGPDHTYAQKAPPLLCPFWNTKIPTYFPTKNVLKIRRKNLTHALSAQRLSKNFLM